MTSGYFDNQNGGNKPGREGKGSEGSQSEEKTSQVEAESAPKTVTGEGAGKEISLTRFQLDLWKSAALRNDPSLSLSWWPKKEKQAPQSGPEQTTSGGSRSVSYSLDLMGNRTNVNQDGVNKSYVPNNLNQYTTAEGNGVSNGASHEISSYGGTDYAYIGDSYLAKASTGNSSYKLYYDALGRCVKRTTVLNGGTATTNYYIFDNEHWVVEYNGLNEIKTAVLYGRGIDEMIAAGVKDESGYFYFQDRNGNVSVVTDGSTGIRESYRYDAFGLPTIFGPGGSTTQPLAESEIGNRFTFTGREWNPAFGFYEYRARAYNPTLGRFMSEDPKGFDAGDYNLYRYVGNDPLDRVDPMGLDSGPYADVDSAYRYFNATYNPTSIAHNVEIREQIYRTAQGQLMANTPLVGSSHKGVR